MKCYADVSFCGRNSNKMMLESENRRRSKNRTIFIYFMIFIPLIALLKIFFHLPSVFDIYTSINRILEANEKKIESLEVRCGHLRKDIASRTILETENVELKENIQLVSNKSVLLIDELLDLREEKKTVEKEKVQLEFKLFELEAVDCNKQLEDLQISFDVQKNIINTQVFELQQELKRQRSLNEKLEEEIEKFKLSSSFTSNSVEDLLLPSFKETPETNKANVKIIHI